MRHTVERNHKQHAHLRGTEGAAFWFAVIAVMIVAGIAVALAATNRPEGVSSMFSTDPEQRAPLYWQR
jgi:hypothetical protein